MTRDRGQPVVLGIDLGGTKCHGAVGTPAGALIAEEGGATDPTRAYETVLDIADALRRQARGCDIAAVAVGVPGVVDTLGRVVDAPNVGWRDFELGTRLVEDLALPVLVLENDADLAAVGEAVHGVARGAGDFVVVAIGTGIGGALVVDGRLLKGRHAAAGEIGAMVFDRSALGAPTRGGLGWFEARASGPGLETRAAELLAETAASTPSGLDADHLSAAAILAASRTGDATAALAVDELLDLLAMALIALASGLDPALIVLDGGLGRALGPELGELSRRVGRHAQVVPPLHVSSLRPTATLVGALVAAGEAVRREVPGPHFATLARSMDLA